MQHADDSHDSADMDKRTDPRTGRRTDDEVIVERTPIVADAPRAESDLYPAAAMERRRGERRRIDRMSTGI
jgi:hypothetical protein